MPTTDALLAQLSQPPAYTPRPDSVLVHQTHISMVFLVGDLVYKIKKPVRLGFLDFSSLEQRRHFCEQEVRLNRRLAPHVYLGVVPVVARNGRLLVEAEGEPVEWAVKMRRLPDAARLGSRIEHGQVDATHMASLARRLAAFHAAAHADPALAHLGSFETMAGNCAENFEQTRAHRLLPTPTVSHEVWTRTRGLTQQALQDGEPILRARFARGVPRDAHGDLRLDHVYHFPDRAEPDDWVIIDCIEFNERFRYADPMADAAFLVMDLAFASRRDLAAAFVEAYVAAAADAEGRSLLPLYCSYRAVVRAKVEGMALVEKEIPPQERRAACERARALWLRALSELAPPAERPCLVLVAGLPGTGKSTLARALALQAGFTVLRSDVVRRELAATADAEERYAAGFTRRTYEELLRRADAALFLGKRVLLDANFRRAWQRDLAFDLAGRWRVPLVFLVLSASPECVRQRLLSRANDASEADWQVYQQLAAEWEDPPPGVAAQVDTEAGEEAAAAHALAVLRAAGLC